MKSTTAGQELFECFVWKNGLSWNKVAKITTDGVGAFTGKNVNVNPFSPAKAPNLAELCNPITRQAIELESYPNHPRIQQVL